MNTVLWILQAILGIKFVSVAFTHGLRQSRDDMRQGIRRIGPAAPLLLWAVAVIMLLGCAGLLLPRMLHWQPQITPLTAGVLAAAMLVSIPLHIRCREKPVIIADVVLFLLAAAVAYGRWVIVP